MFFGSGGHHIGEQPDASTGARMNPLPDKPRPSCSCKKFGQECVTQRLYRCQTCKMSPCAVICPGCAAFCHSGHQIQEVGTTYGICACGAGSKNCYCFLMNPVDGDEDFEHGEYRQCRYLFTGRDYEIGPMASCVGCGQEANRVACKACVRMCHKHHNIRDRGLSHYFCDCGAEVERWGCKIMPKASGEIIHCSRFITDVNHLIADTCTLYECTTCGIAVCESCRVRCHSGHNCQTNVSRTGACQCDRNTCVDMMNKEPAA